MRIGKVAQAKKSSSDEAISILKITEGAITFCVLGKTPLILHRLAKKAQNELLLPARRKNSAEKASSLKHNPYEEFRDSADRSIDDAAPTRLMIAAACFKKSMASAALDIPGTAKAQIGRLTYVPGDFVHVYGIPKLHMAITRSADINHTPDVRTRCIVPEWAAYVTVTYVKPILREQEIANLMAAAGIMRGVGDWRPEKGAGSYGQFELVSADDERFTRIIRDGGREAQDERLAKPVCYNAETQELLTWFDEESARRGFQVAA